MVPWRFGDWHIVRFYTSQLARRPVATQVVSGTVLVSLGDAAAQHLVDDVAWQEHDWARMGNMIFLRGILHSSMIIYWYRLLQAKLPMPNRSRYTKLATHLALDQGFFGPFNVFFFFVASGLLEGKSKREIEEKLDDRLYKTITSAWMLWIPFQFITFRFIPMNHRLLAGQSVAIGWNCFMSYQNYHASNRYQDHLANRDKFT